MKDAWNELKRKGVDTSDHTHGVLQAIGLKEFAPLLQKLDSKNGNIKMDYLQQPEYGNGDQDVDGHGADKMGKTRDATRRVDDQHNLNDKMDGLQIANSGNDGDDMDKEVQECVQNVKLHTRQYSRQQMKWIRKLVDRDGKKLFFYRFSFLVSRFSFLVSRFSFLVSRFSFLVSRFSFLSSLFSLLSSLFSLQYVNL